MGVADKRHLNGTLIPKTHLKQDQNITARINTVPSVSNIADKLLKNKPNTSSEKDILPSIVRADYHPLYQRLNQSVKRTGRSIGYSEACLGLNHRAMCPWSYSIRTNSSRLPKRVQVATCTYSTPRFLPDGHLSNIQCEEIYTQQRMRIVDCSGPFCTELVPIPIGCIPVIPCIVQV